jgi:hypothetical protein
MQMALDLPTSATHFIELFHKVATMTLMAECPGSLSDRAEALYSPSFVTPVRRPVLDLYESASARRYGKFALVVPPEVQ